MRILVFNWRDVMHPWAGGAEVNLHEQAKRWVQAGHHVTLFCGAFDGGSRYATVDGIETVRRGGRFSVYLWAVLYFLVRFRGRYDVIVDVENGIPFFTPLFSRAPKVCVAYHVHTEQFRHEFSPPLARLGIFLESVVMPRVYRNAAFVTISESSRNELLQIGVRADQCSVIYTGVDHATYEVGGEKTAHPTLLYVGRLMRYKRADLLIGWMQPVLERYPDAVLHIVGIGPTEKELRRLVVARGLTEHVCFHGYASEAEKVRLLQQSWLLVTPSMKEGWGLVVIEANACGTPAVAFDVPGLRESIRHGVSGLLADDPDAFLAAILRVLGDATLRQALSDGAVQHARRFGWEQSAASTLAALVEQVRPRTVEAMAELEPTPAIAE